MDRRAAAYLIGLSLLVYLMLGLSAAEEGGCRIGVQENVPWGLPWYHVAVIGDNRPSDASSTGFPRPYTRFVSELSALRPFAVVGTGDHTGVGSRRQIEAFIDSLWNTSNVWVIEGNHDIGSSSDIAYWHRVVAPPMYYEDAIPGWRFVFFSTELSWDKYSALRGFLAHALNTSRNTVLVFHRPLYPDVGYNMDPRLADLVRRVIDHAGSLKLVLQGHWHGYVEAWSKGVRYIITAGGGAPLYQPGAKHHFLLLTLYPNGTMDIVPVSLEEGYIDVGSGPEGCLRIRNTLKGLEGAEVAVPARLVLRVSGVEVYVVLMALPGVTEVCYSATRAGVVAINVSRPTDWYVYVPPAPMPRVNHTIGGATLTLNIAGIVPYTLKEKCVLTQTDTKTSVSTRKTTKTLTITETSIHTVTSSITTTMFASASTCTVYSTETLYRGWKNKHLVLAGIGSGLSVALILWVLGRSRASS